MWKIWKRGKKKKSKKQKLLGSKLYPGAFFVHKAKVTRRPSGLGRWQSTMKLLCKGTMCRIYIESVNLFGIEIFDVEIYRRRYVEILYWILLISLDSKYRYRRPISLQSGVDIGSRIFFVGFVNRDGEHLAANGSWGE